MLSYQHIYHAGNHVDCHKHSMLSALLFLCDQGFHYIDTHSGRGMYDLGSAEARKIAEYKTGIDKIWPLGNWPKELRTYQHFLEALNPDGVCSIYPGSPHVALAHAKADDLLDLYEIHPQELAALRKNIQDNAQVNIHNSNGWEILADNLPASDKQKIILIDPSYELKDEYDNMPHLVTQALHQDPQAIILVWYPMLAAKRHETMLNDFKHISDNVTILKNDIMVTKPENATGLYGTGLLCVNPPTGYSTAMNKISAWLTKAIGIDHSVEVLSIK